MKEVESSYEGIYEVLDQNCPLFQHELTKGQVQRESEFVENAQELATAGAIRLIGFVRCVRQPLAA